MAIKRELIQFTIVNSTDCSFNLPLFQQNVYSVNATTKYSWDVTTADISCGTGTIIVNSVTYNLTYTPTLAGLLSSLNALGFGFFCTETVGGNTYIYVVDDTNVYGDLDLCGVATTTTSTTTTTTTAVPTTTTTTTTTSSTTTTTTGVPTTSTTTTTTTGVPTTTTTTTTTSSTTTTTTGVPTTSTTTTTTTDVPTTTTTTSTTTTTTLCVGTFSLVNNSDDLDISGMLIGGASVIVTSGAFPSTPATTINGTPDSSLTIPNVYALQLSQVTSGIAGQTITVVDSLGDSQTQTIPVGTNDIIFNGVDFNCVTTVIITCNAAAATTTTTSTTTTTTTAAPTTSTTTTTTTDVPTTTTTTTSTTTTTTTLFSNLFFDGSVSNCGYYITAIDVNSVAPTLTGGTNVPFCTDGHNYNTTQTGTNETLNLTIGTFTLNGCITVVDSASNSFQQNVTGNGNLAFTGLTIDNTTAVVITLADNAC